MTRYADAWHHHKPFHYYFTQVIPELKENKSDILRIVQVEEDRYYETLARGKQLVDRMTKDLKKGERITNEKLIELYDSHGLNPELVKEFASVPVEVPDDFYRQVAAKHEKPEEAEEAKKEEYPEGLPTTRALYYEDVDMLEFQGNVVDIINGGILLDQTAFYPEGGGQEWDLGTLDGHKVTKVTKVNSSVLHFIDGALPKKGQVMKGAIDRERRHQLMRHHTSAHIINGTGSGSRGPAPGAGCAEARIKQPVVEAMGDTRSIGEILFCLSDRVPGSVSRAFKDLGGSEEGFVRLRTSSLLPWEEFVKKGVWRGPAYHYGRYSRIFSTPTKKFEFESGNLRALQIKKGRSLKEGTPFSPHYSELKWLGEEKQFPLLLFPYQPLLTFGNGSQNYPWAQEIFLPMQGIGGPLVPDHPSLAASFVFRRKFVSPHKKNGESLPCLGNGVIPLQQSFRCSCPPRS